jgi:hypothetical protein
VPSCSTACSIPSDCRFGRCALHGGEASTTRAARAAAQCDRPAWRTIVQDLPCFSISTKPADS